MFVEEPIYSNRNVKISWLLNEEATTTCTLQTPSSTMIVTCNYTLQLANLMEGGHFLYIQMVDVAGNIAPIVRHTWTVGKRIKFSEVLLMLNALIIITWDTFNN